jgi:hypothetical protein
VSCYAPFSAKDERNVTVERTADLNGNPTLPFVIPPAPGVPWERSLPVPACRGGICSFSTLPGAPRRQLKRNRPGWRSHAMELSPIHFPAAGNVQRIEIMPAKTKARRRRIAR